VVAAMKHKLLLCLALVLSGGLFGCATNQTTLVTNQTNANAATHILVAKMINPQGSVELPKLGQAIFREQSSSYSLQVPVGSRKNGEPMSNPGNLDLQVWLLETSGTSIPQSESPSEMSIGMIGDYSTEYMFYQFPKVPVNELSGVVISMHGKLYCHEIERSQGKP
jgi:hypothetical protein